jgi:hypothetical protein
VVLSRPAALILALAVGAGGCSRARPPAPPAGEPPGQVRPDVELRAASGFTAEPPLRGDGFVRRAYARGRARIEVTVAHMPMSADEYQRWVAGSAAFPQADLGLPPGDANGFYQCTDAPAPSCDLLIQFRAGYHLEIRGDGTSTRQDVDALARALFAGWTRPSLAADSGQQDRH